MPKGRPHRGRPSAAYAYLMTKMSWPPLTVSPSFTRISDTVPDIRAVMAVSIFIASMVTRVWFFSTVSPQDLPVVDGQGHARHGLPLPGVEFHMQISDLQHQDTPPFRRCRPSPMRPTPKISSTMAPPEPRAYQGALVSIPCASESM